LRRAAVGICHQLAVFEETWPNLDELGRRDVLGATSTCGSALEHRGPEFSDLTPR